MTRAVLQPIHRIQQALESLSYWNPVPVRRVPTLPIQSPLDQMYAYWHSV